MRPVQSDIQRRVLIVDDDPSIRLLLGEALESIGFRVSEAEDGEQALAFLEDCVPDLIMLDVMMPGMDGFEVCTRIRSNSVLFDVPIVMVTGNNDLDSIQRAYNLGITDFITKPIHWDVIGYRVSFIIRATNAFSDLKKSEARLVQAQRIARIGSWEWEEGANKISFSDEALRVFHQFPLESESSYQAFISTICPIDRTRTESTATEAADHSDSFSIDHQLSLSDGTACFVHTEAEVIRGRNGVPIRLEGTVQDISERRRAEAERQKLEQQFQQAQKLESLGVLAGGIAHDFNNILTIILGHCFLVKEDTDTGMTDKGHVQQIEVAASRAADLCRQMLAYAGSSPLQNVQINLWQLIDETVTMLQSSLKKNVSIQRDLKSDVPEISGDNAQIHQVVMNLVINAAEAIGDKVGTVRISLDTVLMQAEQSETDVMGNNIQDGTYVCLEVSDTGCGIDEATKKRIFEPFFTTKFTGRGLGMSAVLGIIKSHNGAVQLASRPGTGTSFKVFFPFSGELDADKTTQPDSPASFTTAMGTVLLVDDEESLRIIGSAMLNAIGFSTITAASGREALEIYRKQKSAIDLIMLETGCDNMYYELRNINPIVPIVISSTYGVEGILEKINADEYVSAIQRPYHPDQLRSTLLNLLDKTGEQSNYTAK